MGAPQHRLTDVDQEGRTATCSVCGPTRIRYRPKGRSECFTKRIENSRPTPHFKRRQNLRRRYGLSESEIDALECDGDTCPICERTVLRLYVDHDHACCPGRTSCGQCIRGAICTDCNLGLARFGDDPAALARASTYLRR